ncbi:MAG: nuclear transport factor 2 family protein [Rubrobacter sp.]|nr:nuclear transport factor 2 family protein [Rubrobacter sp.]
MSVGESKHEMTAQRVPNLEEMDEQQARVFLEGMMSDLGAESGYEVRHQDFVMEIPQSGERVRGRERMREFQAAFGQSAPAMRLRRLLVSGGLWVAEVVSDYGDGRVFHYVSMVELRDGKMWRDTRYYAEPFEAPEWRTQWVERMEEG